MWIGEHLTFQTVTEGISAHHLFCLLVELAVDENQRLFKIQGKQTKGVRDAVRLRDVQTATTRDLFDVARSGILDKFVGGLK